jgi:hypothetical protein
MEFPVFIAGGEVNKLEENNLKIVLLVHPNSKTSLHCSLKKYLRQKSAYYNNPKKI